VLESTLRKENKASQLGPRLETISSVGPVIASAFRARVTDPKLFKNGRHLSAWIATVPENDSTGGKVKQKGLSKRGDRYLRSLLVTGAMVIVRQAKIRPDKHPWVTKLLGRMSAKLPDVPTIAEFVPGYAVSNWFAIFGPARPPMVSNLARVDRISSSRRAASRQAWAM
jgi:transposase